MYKYLFYINQIKRMVKIINMKCALITGITGQDGSYLAELLLSRGYRVYGLIRPTSTVITERIDHIFNHENLKLRYGDLLDTGSITRILKEAMPDEIYNLAAQSHVGRSFLMPEYTNDVNYMGVSRLLTAIEDCGLLHTTRFYQASTSELYGAVVEIPQKESTPFNPQSPYACSKLASFNLVKYYRDKGLFACNGILFNHESERRGITFVTRKTTMYVAKYFLNKTKEPLIMGCIDSRRDWGYAPDYVEGMVSLLNNKDPLDIVLATGETTSVRDMIILSFKCAKIDIEFVGEKENEYAINKLTGDVVVRIDPKLYRPTEVDLLIGDSSLANSILGWKSKTSFQDMILKMVNNDIEKYSN